MKMKYVAGLTLLFVISFLFLWFQLRPSQIRTSCQKSTMDKVKNINGATTDTYEFAYKICLREKGLEK